ncbi:MAG: arginine--tRNA ligase, partial [Clostridiales bacterium]|nr:arginine--tRNA ligase [Clostridiales bacterium]
MSSIVQTAENQIREVIKTAFNEAVENDKLTALKLGDINLEVPADIKNGDYSTNAAFMLASSQKKAPRVIADILSEYISLENTYFSNVEVAAAGFINFFLNS